MILPLFTGSMAVVGLQTAYGTTTPMCGDGNVDLGEECDESGANGTICGCNDSCQFPELSTPCELDGNMCTNDQCDGAGACVTVSAVTCVGLDNANGDGVCDGGDSCNPLTGVCEPLPDLPLSTPCELDGNMCTNDQCDGAGACVTVSAVICADGDGICEAGAECNPATGICEDLADPELSTPCEGDGDLCTVDHCDGAGFCVTLSAVICDGVQCGENECDPNTGQCEVAPDDLVCDIFDQCIAGFCDINGGCFGNPDPFNGLECDGGIGICTDGECIPQDADIHVLKFNDLNADRVQDEGEDGIEGWVILLECIDGTSRDGTTDPDGMVWFEDIPAPNQCTVFEEQRLNWFPTTPTSITVELNPEDKKEVTFGNVRALETEKFYTETDKDIENGFFGTLLPIKDDGTQTVQAVIHPKTGKITSYNPGQYYAVTKVTALTDLQEVWITEDDNLCTEVNQPISKMNPAKVPGGAYVALMCPDGTSVDLSSELAHSDPPRLFINDNNNVEAHVENVPEGCMVFLGVKYSPGLKGEIIDKLKPQDLFCENWEIVCANLTHEDNGNTDNANASTENNLIVCATDVTDSAHRVLEVVKCGENEEEDPLGECVCKPGFEETPSGICVAAEF